MSDKKYQWIRVEDQEPPLDTPIWLYAGNKIFIGGLIMAGGIDDEFKAWANANMSAWNRCDGSWDADLEFDDDYHPTHWMPLPSLPTI